MLSAIILAAGRGKRLGSKVSKPLVKINKRPLIDFSLKAFDSHPGVDEIIVVFGRENKNQVLKEVGRSPFNKKVRSLVLGGKRRQDSVFNGLKKIDPHSNWVLIHDSARPFIDQESITRVIRQAREKGAAILAVPVKATVKSARLGLVIRTIDRSGLWEVQTPQVFRKALILKAYQKHSENNVTDDACLVEKLGNKVSIVRGKDENLKITTRFDLLLAQFIERRLRNGI